MSARALRVPAPQPMTEQDLADWQAAIDARSSVGDPGRDTDPNVINAGEAAIGVINARRGRS